MVSRKRYKLISKKSVVTGTKFNYDVLTELEKLFKTNQFVVGYLKKTICKQLNLCNSQLENWFYNRRKKNAQINFSLNS
jgi:hypothetical protein